MARRTGSEMGARMMKDRAMKEWKYRTDDYCNLS